MPRLLRSFPLLIALALAATAFMTVLLPSTTAGLDQGLAQTIAVEQAPVVDAALERVLPEPRGRSVAVAVPTLAPTEEPPVLATPAPTAAPPVATAPPPAACPENFFCYPRLGIAGPIVAYNDCSGVTDVGLAIRQLTCIRAGIWLAGHAYTQFGGIAGFRLGDVVFVRGQRFEITGSSVQRACAPVTGAIAPLSLQTSLDSTGCGRVLVVQGR